MTGCGPSHTRTRMSSSCAFLSTAQTASVGSRGCITGSCWLRSCWHTGFWEVPVPLWGCCVSMFHPQLFCTLQEGAGSWCMVEVLGEAVVPSWVALGLWGAFPCSPARCRAAAHRAPLLPCTEQQHSCVSPCTIAQQPCSAPRREHP